MKTLIAALFFSLFLIACGGGGSSGGGAFPIIGLPIQPTPGPETPVDTSPKCTIGLWGDSVLYGGVGLIYRIQTPIALNMALHRPAWKVYDYSENGASATWKLPLFLQAMHDYDIVVLQYGINDVGNNMPYETSMRSMIEHARAKGKTVVITGLSEGAIKNKDLGNEVARKLALEYGLLYADWPSVPFKESDTHDGVHPIQMYSNLLMIRLVETIELTGCKS